MPPGFTWYDSVMQPQTLHELERALQESGGVVCESSFVIMTIEVYRQIMGVGTDEELAASVAGLRDSMAEARQGKTRPLTEALDDLGRKYEISR